MMHAHQRISVIDLVNQFLHVAKPQEIAIAEYCPTLESGEIRYRESSVGKLGRRQRIAFPHIVSGPPQGLLS